MIDRNNVKDSIAKILIVDDNENNLIAMQTVLESSDADIYLAHSGSEALKLILEHDFAVVLLDVQMPDMDGFETAELMRKNKHTEHTPIIFVTAISKEKMKVIKGYESGAVDYLFKPVDPYVLQAKVKIFLDLYYQKTREIDKVMQDLQDIKLELQTRQQALDDLKRKNFK